MGYNEKIWLNECNNNCPLFYRRYVDDIFAVFENKEKAIEFLAFLNGRHPNIKFTSEENENGVLPFLDIIIRNRNRLETSVFHKSTYTGLLTNFKSFVPFTYKKRLIDTLLDRTFKINSSWNGLDLDFKALKNTFLKNLYPCKLIDKCIKKFLNKKFSITEPNIPQKDITESNCKYVTLPYIGNFSKVTRTKIQKLVKNFCKPDVQLNIVFTIFKIKNYFSTKDPLPECFKSHVVYSFLCPRCQSCYVGRTHAHFDTRINQHLNTDKKSSIFNHINNNKECKELCDKNAFSILDIAKTNYELALKESMHIKWRKPTLNIQKKHIILKLLI